MRIKRGCLRFSGVFLKVADVRGDQALSARPAKYRCTRSGVTAWSAVSPRAAEPAAPGRFVSFLDAMGTFIGENGAEKGHLRGKMEIKT